MAITRALDAAQRGDSAEATRIVEAVFERCRVRAAEMKKARHDLGNLLAIATASVEAMVDGVAPITSDRLERVCEVLSNARDLLYAATPEAD